MVVGMTVGIHLIGNALEREPRRAGLLIEEEEDRPGEPERPWYHAQSSGSAWVPFRGAAKKN